MRKPLPNNPGYSINRKGIIKDPFGQKINIRKRKNCYLSCSINGKTLFLHRLVAEVFIPNPNNLPQVNHLDGNKHNPYYKNLEWSTQSTNVKHAYGIGLIPQRDGANNPNAKLSENDIKEIRELNGLSNRQISLMYGVSTSLINKIINYKRWSHI